MIIYFDKVQNLDLRSACNDLIVSFHVKNGVRQMGMQILFAIP